METARQGGGKSRGNAASGGKGARLLPPYGGYKNLLSYQRAEVVYDATVRFCEDFFQKRDRTVDQMVQAARSGTQNIVEGSMASGTSREMELKLTNEARASLEELLTDYRDLLRSRGAAEWEKSSKEALYVRRVAAGKIVAPGREGTQGTKATKGTQSRMVTDEDFRCFEDRPAEVRANIVISLIKQTNYLLDQQIRKLEEVFLREGGLRERMTRARLAARDNPPPSAASRHGGRR